MKTKTILALVFLTVFVIAFGYLSIFGVSVGVYDVSVVDNIQRGLDLTGGVSTVYEAKDSNVDNLDDKMDGAVEVFRNRLDKEGYTEATVVRQGEDRIRVEIPINESTEITNPEEVIAFLGKPAKLEFKDPDGNVIMEGKDIETAQAQRGEGDQYVVYFKLTGDGTTKFAEATSRLIGQNISINLDDVEISAPTVNTAITGGEGIVEGSFTAESARQLAVQIESGALPIELEEIEVRSISATLGEDALKNSIIAGIIGLIAVIIFMIIVYRLQGVVASMALTIYILLMLFCLATIKGVQLSLPGVAGMILSIGMAVDANVIIFERMKEELNSGKTIDTSIKSGFDKAMLSILDSNVTTLIAAVVLYFFGTGPIKGFAITLSIGIVLSMITAVVVTKYLLKACVLLGFTKPTLYTNIKE